MNLGRERLVYSLEEGQSKADSKVLYYEVENLLCFERAIRFCYASLEVMIHNRNIRHQCQTFYQCSLSNEKELEKILLEVSSEDVEIHKTYDSYSLPADDFHLESVLSLGLVVAGYRLDIYQELRNHLPMKSRILLNHFISHLRDEIEFFKREKELVEVDSILYNLN